ncbi:MAG: TIGR03013 family XrtA/PEP-CTERM system glycosyltransferase, partial [Planctomycetota bacterium]
PGARPGARLVDAPAAPGPREPLQELAARLRVDQIVVAFEERRGNLPTDELLKCRLGGIFVQEAESFYERLTGKIPAEAMRPSYLIFNTGFDMHPLAATAKRLCDFTLSALGLLVLWPVMLLVALAVRLDSPGPVLFRQERTGQRGRPFTLCKFRSMRTDAEKLTGPVWATENDPRVTKIGRFIRKTRLDELPQLFNILSGSMSLVGPRPERPHFVAELAHKIPYFNQRHIAKPGLTGWAQINYPYGNTVEDALQKLQYDLFYIKYQSLLFDLSILFNTVKTVLLRKGT